MFKTAAVQLKPNEQIWLDQFEVLLPGNSIGGAIRPHERPQSSENRPTCFVSALVAISILRRNAKRLFELTFLQFEG